MTDTQVAGLGEELRAARQAHGWELPQLAASLRIRQSYLEAIEAGRVGDLPGTTYALGFVRAYASALGLPGEDIAKRFRAETTLVNGQPTLRFPAPVPQRGVPAGALMLLGVVILAGAYGGWYWVTEHRATPVEIVPPIPDRMVPETQKPLPSPQVASLLPAISAPAVNPAGPAAGAVPGAGSGVPPAGQGVQTPAAAIPAVLPRQAPQPRQTPTPEGVAGSPVATPLTQSGAGVSATPAQPASGQPASSPAQAGASPSGAEPSGTRLVIRTTADAWVTVKQKGGPAVLNKLMHAGESWPMPPGKDGLTLTTGNAGATLIDVDGAPIQASLGGSGAVRRDLPLDPDMLKSGKLPPPPARTRLKVPAPVPQD